MASPSPSLLSPSVRLKLQVAEEQVADQHAYLLQLKHLQADPDLITKEQLVEKQLRKRQVRPVFLHG